MMEEVTAYFDELGREIGGVFFLVGGCVRDELRGVPCSDYDLVVRRLDAETLFDALSSRGFVKRIGDQFEVFEFHPDDLPERFEIALPRTETTTGIGHRGFTPVSDPFLPIEEDLKRRDYTVNALARNVHTGELHDPLGGKMDIDTKRLHAANPQVFADDPLRILRGLRFVSQLGFTPNPPTRYLMTRYAHRLEDLPGERIQGELAKIVMGKYTTAAFRLARDLGVLAHFLPELARADGCGQNKWHSFFVDEHILAVLENTESDDVDVRLGALFHDIGKPPTKWIDLGVDPTGNPHFYQNSEVPGSRDHDEVGAEMTREIMTRLKFSKDQIDRVSGFVLLHMFPQHANNRRPAARRLLKRIHDTIPGDLEANVRGLFAIRYGDCKGGKVYAEGSIEATELAEALAINARFEKLVMEELANEAALTVKDLALNGHDFMKIGFEGIAIGIEQKRLLELVLEDPSINTRETLLRMSTDWFTGDSFYELS